MRSDFYIASTFFLLFFLASIAAWPYPIGGKIFPFLVIIPGMIMSLAFMGYTFRSVKAWFPVKANPRAFIQIGWALGYFALCFLIGAHWGIVIGNFLYALLHREKLITALAIGVLSWLLLWGFEKYFTFSLPPGFLF